MREESRITKTYLLELITNLKSGEKELEQLSSEKKLWEERRDLATTKGRSDLAEGAGKRLTELDSKIQVLANHLRELGMEIRKARGELKDIESSPELSLDPTDLLERLETMGGKVDPMADEMKSTEADSALDALKKEMGL